MENERKLMQFHFITKGEISTHYHQNPELFYVLTGELNVQIDDTKYPLRKGDILLINANKRHLMIGSEDLLGARFEIDFHLLAEEMGTMQLMFWCNTVADKNAAYDDLRKILERILERYFERDQKGALYLNSLCYEALYILTSNFMIQADDTRIHMEDSQDRIRIRQIQNYIQANYQSQISLNDLAERLYLSNAYLSKYVKKHLGLTFMEYLNNVRLFHAVDELLYTNKNITRIALDNGFPTSAAFTKAFRDIHGEAPSEYRKKMKYEITTQEADSILSETEKNLILEFLKYRENPQEEKTKYERVCEADGSQYQPMNHIASNAISIGDAYSLLQSDVQKQVLEIQKKTGIKYARIWNLLSKKDCFDGRQEYNFRKLDLVLDFLVENHLIPYLELGDKPTLFMYTPERSIKEEMRETYDHEAFLGITKALCMHLANRYGVEELEKWYFEYWNDPQLHMEKADGIYYDNFELIYQTLKQISPTIRVGGSGFVLGYETLLCRKIFSIWKKRDIRPDFLSFCSFQYIAVYENDIRYGRKSIDSSYIRNQVAIMREVMEEAEFQVPEFHIDEWNFTISNRNVINDSCEQGAYIMKNCIDLAGEIDVMAYWHALDIYSDYYDTNLVLNGDSGLITRDGIAKPSFYAFTFLNKLLSNVIAKDENMIITTNGRDRYVIACHNFKCLSSQYVFTEEDEIKVEELINYMEDSDSLKLKFVLNHMKNGTYLVKTFYVNRTGGSVQDLWRKMEYAKGLARDEMEYLKRSASPRMEMKSYVVENGILEIENVLLEQEIRLLDIQYQYDL